ncbi:16S rRNA (guanine(527)-N(7))-methyltransferase RsmG [Winogradskyella aurantiaca]|uniref:16S rRNA (guanine(527)-N(7))-methyltransferase RsmG n=1 Tax=Winogradskyella aurantiaca TaxID=2219558 RepID=UPI000E1DB22E|nr:16S rRNA (guanine(527)-N(7))-methyltransferase RsmG [Winogradskyella aurantiaca]
MELVHKYFPNIDEEQVQAFESLHALYMEWNAKINVISRKDIDELYLRHVLHSLGIAKVLSFLPGTKILDIGTGGGFPGIPLAILFPEVHFHLVDSIGKKIRVVNGVKDAIGLTNLTASHQRAEKVNGEFDFIVSRAVTQMNTFYNWTKGKVSKKSKHDLRNGILYLKGGDLKEELKRFPNATIYPLNDYFNEAFFETKSVVHIPLKKK